MTEPRPKRRRFQFGLRTLLIAVALFCLLLGLTVPFFKFVALHQDYYWFVEQTRYKIESLSTKRPPNVPPDQWQQAVDSTSNVICQIYFSPNHGDLDSLKRLCKSLDQEIAGQVDLTTLQWIWEECEKAEGLGQVYAIRFRDVRLLTAGRITDDSLPGLWSLDNCLWLDLINTQLTDAGLEHLKSLRNLQNLWLDGTQVTPKASRSSKRHCRSVRLSTSTKWSSGRIVTTLKSGVLVKAQTRPFRGRATQSAKTHS